MTSSRFSAPTPGPASGPSGERDVRRPERPGIVALPLAALLFLVGIPLRGRTSTDTVTDATAFAAQVVTTRYWVGFSLIVLGFGVLLLAVVALAGHIARFMPRLAGTALVLGAIGIALVLPLFGVVGFGYRAVGQAVNDGTPGALAVANAAVTGPVLILVYAGGLAYLVAFVLLAVGSWRSRTGPRWAAVALVVSIALLVSPPTLALEVAAAALLLLAGGAIAVGVRGRLPAHGYHSVV